jgi:uncharacterized protein DUF4124
MVRFFKLCLLLLGTLLAVPAWSEVYKWVDEDGVVNYSNQPPSNRKAEELDLNSIPISVIETDKVDQRAAWAAKSEVSSLRQKVDQLESQLQAERYARGYSVEPAAAPVDYGYPGYLYAPGVVFFQPHHRKPHVKPTRFIPTPRHSFSGMQPAGFPSGMTPSFVNVR